MAFAVMTAAEPGRYNAILAAHLPSLNLPEFIFYRAFTFSYENLPITLTNEARRKYHLQRVNMTDILPSAVEKHLILAEQLARDNHPMIRVLKECHLHKEMLFTTPVMHRSNNQIVGMLLAYDKVPDDLCPSPGHLLNHDSKTGFLTSLFKPPLAAPAPRRGWTFTFRGTRRESVPASPNPSEKTLEMIDV